MGEVSPSLQPALRSYATPSAGSNAARNACLLSPDKKKFQTYKPGTSNLKPVTYFSNAAISGLLQRTAIVYAVSPETFLAVLSIPNEINFFTISGVLVFAA